MKKRELDSLCRSTCDYLCSRNNDISGYWGIGVLCRLSFLKARRRLGFRTAPGLPIHIFGCELSNSSAYTSMLGTLGVDSIEGRLSFFDDGRFVNKDDLPGAYAESWALTFFLLSDKSHASDFAAYLKEMTKQQPLGESDARQRVELFKKHFGSNLTKLDGLEKSVDRSIATATQLRRSLLSRVLEGPSDVQ